MAEPNRTEKPFGKFCVMFRPFSIPEGVFDEKRLVSDKEYEQMLKDGKLKRNVIDPRYKK